MVFFPSYKFMEDVLEVYENEFSAEWVRCISQTSGMNEREKEEFLEEFSASEGTLVGFCVMGGIFSEGIDLMGEKLIGAIIIGTGLPQIGTEREILRQYYEASCYKRAGADVLKLLLKRTCHFPLLSWESRPFAATCFTRR